MIYIAAHKKFDVPELEGYCPLHVGAEGKEPLGYTTDNTGENISERNPNYCELTGLYWIWKNTQDPYKGLVHYRRYFGKSSFANRTEDIYTYVELTGMLKDADMILPEKDIFHVTGKEQILRNSVTPETLEKLRKVVEKKYPEYLKDYDAVFDDNKASLYNMMVCRGKVFDAYCSWLFDILMELETQIDYAGFTPYQMRIYGFLSERLLNIYVRHNDLKCRYLPVINTGESKKEILTKKRRALTNRIRFAVRRK